MECISRENGHCGVDVFAEQITVIFNLAFESQNRHGNGIHFARHLAGGFAVFCQCIIQFDTRKRYRNKTTNKQIHTHTKTPIVQISHWWLGSSARKKSAPSGENQFPDTLSLRVSLRFEQRIRYDRVDFFVFMCLCSTRPRK